MNRREFLATSLLLPATAGEGAKAAAAENLGNPRAAARSNEIEDAVWKSYYDKRRVWGYVDRHSIAPGEGFNIMLSTKPSIEAVKGILEISRIGDYPHGDRETIWTSKPLTVERQEVQATAAALGANWRPTLKCVETKDWPSGYYTFDFVVAGGDRDINVAYIVVTNPQSSGDVLLELSTNTYQAYNAWGGHSFYQSDFIGSRGQMVSFDRPQTADFFKYEYYLVTWLEKLAHEHKFKVDYATNFDIYKKSAFVQQYPLLISASHNEYWSKEEFDTVYDRIFKYGKNVLFLGANTAYWQIRYADVNRPGDGEDWGRQLICYKSSIDPIRHRVDERVGDLLVTSLFREDGRRPESMLMGAAYQSWFDPGDDFETPTRKFAYHVAQIDLPLFQGTGYVVGEPIGEVLGYEWDNTDPDNDGNRLWDSGNSQIAPIDPKSIKVLFAGSAIDVDGKKGTAEAVYFSSPAGAKVFSAGSIRWAWGLGKPGFARDKFKLFHRNLVLDLLSRKYG
jgi:hypothetical protein